MFETGGALPPLLTDVGMWLGMAMTLALFSLLLGDTIVARWAQHLLVGASMGYLAVVVVQSVLRPRLVEPLLQGQWRTVAGPAALGLLLLVAGIERIVRQSRTPQAGQQAAGPTGDPAARGLWGLLAIVPVALLLGTGLAVGLAGIVQGTLIPQTGEVLFKTWAAGRVGPAFWYGGLTLLLTTATLLHLTLDRSRHIDALPRPFRDLMRGWVWIGRRALWIAGGVLLARLFASRFTLFYVRIDAINQALQSTGFGQWLATLWQQLFGG